MKRNRHRSAATNTPWLSVVRPSRRKDVVPVSRVCLIPRRVVVPIVFRTVVPHRTVYSPASYEHYVGIRVDDHFSVSQTSSRRPIGWYMYYPRNPRRSQFGKRRSTRSNRSRAISRRLYHNRHSPRGRAVFSLETNDRPTRRSSSIQYFLPFVPRNPQRTRYASVDRFNTRTRSFVSRRRPKLLGTVRVYVRTYTRIIPIRHASSFLRSNREITLMCIRMYIYIYIIRVCELNPNNIRI